MVTATRSGHGACLPWELGMVYAHFHDVFHHLWSAYSQVFHLPYSQRGIARGQLCYYFFHPNVLILQQLLDHMIFFDDIC